MDIHTTPTLLLNASFEPLTLIPLSRAVVLVLAKDAEVIETGELVINSPSMSLPAPSVIRLIKYVKVPYRFRVKLSKKAILQRDRYTCGYCGKTARTIDHVIPRSRGGQHRWDNVVAACGPCNHKKASKLLSELGWELRHELVEPTGRGVVFVGLATTRPDWAPYLAVT